MNKVKRADMKRSISPCHPRCCPAASVTPDPSLLHLWEQNALKAGASTDQRLTPISLAIKQADPPVMPSPLLSILLLVTWNALDLM